MFHHCFDKDERELLSMCDDIDNSYRRGGYSCRQKIVEGVYRYLVNIIGYNRLRKVSVDR